MPIYAFQCDTCGHQFDRLQKLSDPDPGKCAECGAETIRRQVTAPSFRLSGSGWYETDFKKAGDKKRNLTEGGEGSAKPQGDAKAGGDKAADAKPAPASKPETKGGSKAETKPAAKPAD
jgi:putative FmdB family regulatory protein